MKQRSEGTNLAMNVEFVESLFCGISLDWQYSLEWQNAKWGGLARTPAANNDFANHYQLFRLQVSRATCISAPSKHPWSDIRWPLELHRVIQPGRAKALHELRRQEFHATSGAGALHALMTNWMHDCQQIFLLANDVQSSFSGFAGQKSSIHWAKASWSSFEQWQQTKKT